MFNLYVFIVFIQPSLLLMNLTTLHSGNSQYIATDPINNSGTLYTTVDLLQIIPSSHTIPLFKNQHSEYHLTSFAIKPIKTFHTSRTDNLYVHVSCTYNCNCIIEYAMYCMLYNNNTDPPFPPPNTATHFQVPNRVFLGYI